MFFIVSWLRGFAKSGPKNGSAKDRLPKMSTKFAPRLRAGAIWKSTSLKAGGAGALLEVELRKICTTPARESDFCKKKHHAAWSEHFWKLSSAKFAPRLRARSIWKSKSLKSDGLGTFLEVESAFCLAGAGISTRCKIRGRRRGS